MSDSSTRSGAASNRGTVDGGDQPTDQLVVGDPRATSVARAKEIMAEHWREDLGFTVPHATVYPSLWLWDSCFHSIIWAALGEQERAQRELAAVFDAQTDDGFVPHMNHAMYPEDHRMFWGI